ncbi:hypothetical protein EJ04DRAFT_48492 [Polyplosphaeria fusca]|uniref:Uncharacterized protein n=1 Tax=Polyplosphaeria fusca TaxID=682080 RepID=A0A9P4QSQ1_9PLEO|nr:hypothetical protein EJ04DRAFT_48492 [Polyplosphaeria fusca]
MNNPMPTPTNRFPITSLDDPIFGWMAQQAEAAIPEECRGNPDFFESNGSPAPIFCTVALCFFTIMTEFLANGAKNTEPKKKADENDNAPNRDAEANAQENGTQKGSVTFSNPSPRLRMKRLIGASLAIIPVIITFGIRMDTVRSLADKCSPYYGVELNWTFVVLFNIMPFIAASTAWLRAFVDCLLVRWNKSLSYWMWPPVFPISYGFYPLLAVLGLCMMEGPKAIQWLMGNPDMREEGEEATELGEVDEESRPLVADVDAPEDDEVTVVGGSSSPVEDGFEGRELKGADLV